MRAIIIGVSFDKNFIEKSKYRVSAELKQLQFRVSTATFSWRTCQAAARAASALGQALSNAQALMREIAGQGPEKTLYRGFALVRDC
jgi:exonuclease VII large subunit